MQVLSLPYIEGSKEFCPGCEAKSQREADEEKERLDKQAHQARVKRQQIERYMSESCIGKRYMGMTFSSYKPTCQKAAQYLEICKGFAETFTPESGEMLLLVGHTGTGKSMLAAIIGQQLIQTGFSFHHTTVLKLARRFKETWKNSNPETESDALRYFMEPDLLVINEIGVQYGSQTEQQFLFEVIDDRYEAKKSTILISNMKAADVEGFLGDRCIDRLYEEGGMLTFDWESYRKRPAALKVIK